MDENHTDWDAFIRVITFDEAINNNGDTFGSFFTNHVMEKFGKMMLEEDRTPLSCLKTDCRNAVLNVGVCSQAWINSLTEADLDFWGYDGLNCSHPTRAINDTQLKDKWSGLLESMTKFSKYFDDSLFPCDEQKSTVHDMPGYEALTFALLRPDSGKLLTHVDSMNDKREGYNRVATYSKILESGWRLTIIAYTWKSAGDFMQRMADKKLS